MRSGRLVGASKWLLNTASTGMRYLDAGVVVSKLAKLPGGMQGRVMGLLDEVSGSTKRALTDGGEALLVEYLTRTGDVGRRVLDGMPDTLSKRLVSVGDSVTKRAKFQRQVTKAVDEGDITVEEAGKATRQYDNMDAEERELALEAMEESGDDGLDLLIRDVCNSPCDSVIKAAEDFTDARDGLTEEQKSKFLETVKDSDDVPSGVPGDNPGQMMEDLRYLADDVDNVDGAVVDVSPDQAGYTGLAGEVKTTKWAIEIHDAKKGDVTMWDDVRVSKNDVDDIDGLEMGDVNTKSDIDTNVDGGPTYESKNRRNLQPLFPHKEVYKSVGTELDNLRKKLNTWAVAGEDDIVVVVRKDQLGTYSDEARQYFPDGVKDVESLEDLANKVESNFDDVNVEIKTYDEMNPDSG